MQNLAALDPSQTALRISAAGSPLRLRSESRPQNASTFAKQGNQGRARYREDYNSPEKFRMECVLEKPVAPLLPSPPPAGQFLLLRSLSSSFSGAGEGIRTPDPLITNQMLYRLSYASNWGKARSRANLSHGSLPDVRDNYIKYHSANFWRNGRSLITSKLAGLGAIMP